MWLRRLKRQYLKALNNIPVIFENSDLFVLDKPSGLIVDRSETRNAEVITLEDILLEYLKEHKLDLDLSRAGVVHRLDKETSGVILAAKTKAALENLQEQFKNRVVKKEYLAVVAGEITENEFTVDAPLGRNPNSTLKFCVIDGGKPSVTDFKKVKPVLKDGNKYTLLQAFPQTGRTHQIRVHLCAFGTPIASDFLYEGDKMYNRDFRVFGRLMLHAHKITFKLPSSSKEVTFESTLPEQFQALD